MMQSLFLGLGTDEEDLVMSKAAFHIWVCLIVLGGAVSAWAIPATINVSGRLLDQNGSPVYYWRQDPDVRVQITVSLPAQVKLYDSATIPTPFITVNTTAIAYDAFFNISFNLPDAAVVKNSLWYSLAIDVDQNGLTAADNFPDRFEIGSVPFALSAKPVHSYTTFGGNKGGGKSDIQPANLMNVCPFETPQGGVEFNRMNVLLPSGQVGGAFEFGIFDHQGQRIISSGLITIQGANLKDAFLEIQHLTIILQPSTIYYVGMARNNGNYFTFLDGIRPCSPVFGRVTIPQNTGGLPISFSTDSIDPNNDAIAMPITLSLATTSKPGIIWKGKPGGPQYRWIIPSSTKSNY
jgi:hypothetical protein